MQQRLAERLGAEPDIVVAMVFGSAADDRLRPDSDVDVAVLADAPLSTARRQALIAQLAEEFGRPVDLVDMRTAGPVVLGEVLAKGRRLVCRDVSAYAAILARTLLDAADFLPYRQRILRERRMSWTG
ncbi:MAG: nucleotidyltransferase domain-containing protein [Steroidobacteraceae bacterium]